MVLIATNDYLELYDDGNGKGHVHDTQTGEDYPQHSIASIISRGGWEPVSPKNKGGEGSGNFDHAGRPGLVGGSAPNPSGTGSGDVWGGNEDLRAMGYTKVFEDDFNIDDVTPMTANRVLQKVDEKIKSLSEDRQHYVYLKEQNEKGDWDYIRHDLTKEQVNEVLADARTKREAIAKKLEERINFIEGSLRPVSGSYFDDPKSYLPEGIFNKNNMEPKEKSALYEREYEIGEALANAAYKDGITAAELDDAAWFYTDEGNYLHQKSLREMYPDLNKEELSAVSEGVMAVAAGARQQYDFLARRDICSGELSVEDAAKLGRYDKARGEEDWIPLPGALYHVTPAVDSVLAQGLKSRQEMKMRDATGLGGGEEDTISFTTDDKIAKGIEQSMHEIHEVATGRITLAKMIECAELGGGGVGKPWSFIDKTNPGVRELLDRESRGELSDEDKDRIFELYRLDYLNAREYNKGFFNPVWWGTKRSVMEKAKPAQMKVLKLKPHSSKSKGYRLAGLGEIRVVGGRAVDVDSVIDYYDADTPIDLLMGIPRERYTGAD